MNRQKLVLLILLGILLLAVAYAFLGAPRQQRATPDDAARPKRGRAAPAVATRAATEDGRLHLEKLTRSAEEYPGFKRDIFRSRPAMPALPPPPPLPRMALPAAPAPPPFPHVAENGVPAEVQQALARFTFLGFLVKDGRKSIFLSSDADIFVVKPGDRFGKMKEFLVTDLTPEQLTIRQGDDPRPIVVPLQEQAALVPSVGREPAATGRLNRFSRPAFPARTPAGPMAVPVPPEQPEVEEQPFPVEQAPALPQPAPQEQMPGEVSDE